MKERIGIGKEGIVINKIPEIVKCKKIDHGGDCYDIEKFTDDKQYCVWGLCWYIFPDHTRELCYLLTNDEGILQTVATRNFIVIEVKDEKL